MNKTASKAVTQSKHRMAHQFAKCCASINWLGYFFPGEGIQTNSKLFNPTCARLIWCARLWPGRIFLLWLFAPSNRFQNSPNRRAVLLRGLRGTSPSLRFQRATSATPGPPFCLYPRRCSSFITAALRPDEQLFIGTAACKIGCEPAVRTNLYAGRRKERERVC